MPGYSFSRSVMQLVDIKVVSETQRERIHRFLPLGLFLQGVQVFREGRLDKLSVAGQHDLHPIADPMFTTRSSAIGLVIRRDSLLCTFS